MGLSVAILASLGLWGGCHSKSEAPKAARKGAELGIHVVATLVPTDTLRVQWAQAIIAALKHSRRPIDRNSVCAVVAVIGQESNFQANPAVPALASVVKTQLRDYETKYGRPGKALIRSLLDSHSDNDKRSFAARLAVVRTERDLDLTFRDMLAYYKAKHPLAFGAAAVAGHLWEGRGLDELNPIATAGPMQVGVKFAEDWAEAHALAHDHVRDDLYTIKGGVLYGTARLFAHDAGYNEMIFRFADYNAGAYASRNAAVQAQLGRLIEEPLALDGDLLKYDSDGDASRSDSQTWLALTKFRKRFAPQLSEWRLRQDAGREKSHNFEDTDTYLAIKAAFSKAFHISPRYAILPHAEIDSPKLRRKRATSGYALAVQRRFVTCRGSTPDPP